MALSITKYYDQSRFAISRIKLNFHHFYAKLRIKYKKRLTVVFLVSHEASWKYDGVYLRFSQNERYYPLVIVIPHIVYGFDNMLIEMNRSYDGFKKRGYNVLKTFNEINGNWLDVKREISPDIIFFSSPYENFTRSEYFIRNFKNNLTCYVPYNFGNSHMLEMFHNLAFHNLVWCIFAESETHKKYAIKHADNKGKNVIVTGYPSGEKLVVKKNEKPKGLKKIIWAPHHTIDDDRSFISFSSFKIYFDFFLKLIQLYVNKVDFVFKPHPLLKQKLYIDPDWGIIKTDAYYKTWQCHKNAHIHEGDYHELFTTSDGLIHDSGSFLIEYLYTENPVLRTDRDDAITNRLNSFGKMAYDVHYIAKNEEDILKYIEMVINDEHDPLKKKRIDFKNNYLLYDEKPPSELIFNYIDKILK